jgi:diguanylate cyclase (GGDEF)-like protein
MAGDATLTFEISPAARGGLPPGLDSQQLQAAFALAAELHCCYEVRTLAQCVAEHLGALIKADNWRMNFTPTAVRAACSSDQMEIEAPDAPPAFNSAAPVTIRNLRSDNGYTLSVSLLFQGQPLGALEGARHSRTRPFSSNEEAVLLALAPYVAHALARTQRLHELSALSYTDELTRLYNGRYLQQRLVEEIKRARRNGAPVTALFFDLDDFKQINDEHGHLVGSQVIAECGAVVTSVVRETDIVARYGGDEFVVILPETNQEHSEIVAERIRRTLAEHHFHGGRNLRLSLHASFGAACYPVHARYPQELLALADAAMYEAKAAGKNRVCYAPAPSE